jgi:predicted ATPase
MINNIRIKNFKSIEYAEISIAPITLLIGPNASGKSSVIQSIAVLKNFFLNPARSLDEIFNLSYLRLGSYADVVSYHDTSRMISIGADIVKGEIREQYDLELGPKSSSKLSISAPIKVETKVEFTLPYSANQQDRKDVAIGQKTGKLIWNGITLASEPQNLMIDQDLQELYNLHYNAILSVFLVPTVIAFNNNLYPIVGLPDKRTLISIPDAMLVTMLQQDADLEEKMSTYMEEIFKIRDIRARLTYPNISVMVGRKRFATNIVNEGFGLNRIAALLATILATSRESIIAVEEPENHLHPEAQAKLAKVLVEVVKDENKQLIISTHSEHLLLGLLSEVGAGHLEPKDIAVYFSELKMPQMKSFFEKAEVNKSGQIRGGLEGFFEADIQALSEAIKSLSVVHGRDSG